MKNIKQEIFAVDVVDIAIVSVSPVRRPTIRQLKAIPTILELWLTGDDHRARAEMMVMAKVGAELIIRNVASSSGRMSILGMLFGMLLALMVAIPLLHFRMFLLLSSAIPLHLRTFLTLRGGLLACLLLTALFLRFLHLVILPVIGMSRFRLFLPGLRLGFFLPRRFIFLFLFLCIYKRSASYQHRQDA